MKSSTSGNDMEPAVGASSSTVEDGNASLLNANEVSNIREMSITSPKLENSGNSSIDLKINITNRSLDYLGEYEVLRKRVNPPKISNREVLFAKPTAKPNETNVEVNIFCNQKGIIHPRDSYKTPQIRGVKRELAKKELRRELAANWRDKKILRCCKALRAAGNFDSLPSAAVARKIRSEFKRSQDRDPDAFCDLYKMQQDKNWSIFIQRISSPLEIYLYSENQLNLLFKNKGRLFKMSKKTLFFDATASVVEKINKESKRIFLYSSILHARDENENDGILMPKAEAVLCNLCLKTFCQQHRMRWPICQRIVTDWSKAVITAVISAFNDMKSISTYLHKCHNFLIQRGGNLEFLVVQLCCSHIIRMAQKDIATCFENQEVLDFYTKQIIWAIQISGLAEFYSWLKGFFTILTQKNVDGRIEEILGNLKNKTSTGDVTVEAGEEKECLKGEIPLYEQSPFYT
uniref:Uncharacterized protein n=1 Tax=Glossina austeni TaxID=7395 RepID=A0A1A9VU14_GLOAU